MTTNLSIRRIDRTWRTPLTDKAPAVSGTARLKRVNYRGLYNSEGVGGFEFYQTTGWMPVVGLQQRAGRAWKTWMVDDPVHWDGMREAVEDLPGGRVLVAGLGLGLFLHHMKTDERFTEIVVVEANPDVVGLMRPTLPDDPRVAIVVDDFYGYVWNGGRFRHDNFDCVLWDLAVGTPDQTRQEFLKGRAMATLCVGAPLVQFGLKRRRVVR